MPTREFVDLETARSASGLRLIIPGGVPSPWSVAAKAILDVKDIPALIVRKPRDSEVQQWTGVSNVPEITAGAPRIHTSRAHPSAPVTLMTRLIRQRRTRSSKT